MRCQQLIESGRSDRDLLRAHAAGDCYAFAELYGRHQRRLLRLARRTSRSPEDAHDALQDAMLSVHRSAASFRQDSAVGSWLHRIVVNACLDRLRSNSNHATVLLTETPPGADPTVQVDTAMVVHRALMQLSPEQRAAVVAVDMYGCSVAETAQRLGVAEGTVKSRCARARARLAELLRPTESAAVHDGPTGHGGD